MRIPSGLHGLKAAVRYRYLALAIIMIVLLWSYILCASAILYNYIYWPLFSSTVKIASPHTVPPTRSNTSAAPAVPKILHQTWRDHDVPDKWKDAQASCRRLHADYEYRLWTDIDAEGLISTKYPWFLKTYRGYPYDIQRVDAFRYFVLNAYGGIYLDLDIV